MILSKVPLAGGSNGAARVQASTSAPLRRGAGDRCRSSACSSACRSSACSCGCRSSPAPACAGCTSSGPCPASGASAKGAAGAGGGRRCRVRAGEAPRPRLDRGRVVGCWRCSESCGSDPAGCTAHAVDITCSCPQESGCDVLAPLPTKFRHRASCLQPPQHCSKTHD